MRMGLSKIGMASEKDGSAIRRYNTMTPPINKAYKRCLVLSVQSSISVKC